MTLCWYGSAYRPECLLKGHAGPDGLPPAHDVGGFDEHRGAACPLYFDVNGKMATTEPKFILVSAKWRQTVVFSQCVSASSTGNAKVPILATSWYPAVLILVEGFECEWHRHCKRLTNAPV